MLTLVGLNHRSAPLDLRERFALSAPAARATLERLTSDPAVSEAFILSTCNRIEYLVRGASSDSARAVEGHLEKEYGLDPTILERHAYRRLGRDAVRHLFRVTAGLDSMILGEPQIQGQVKDALVVSREAGTTGVVLDRLVQHALAAAKRARSETGISRHAVSVAYAAVSLASKIFGRLEGRNALMLGAGKMGELVAKHLHRKGVSDLIVCGRSFDRADRAARRFGGQAVQWNDRFDRLRNVDIVIGCTGAPQPVLTREHVSVALKARRARALFLIDIAVPRDIEPAVHGLESVYLYDIDALEGVVENNLEERLRAAELAERVIDAEVEAFDRWRQALGVTPLIVALRESVLETSEREVDKLRNRLGPITDAQEETIREWSRSLARKFLDRPTRYLRDSADRLQADRVAHLIRDMFDLKQFDKEETSGEKPKKGPHRLLKGGRDDG